MERDKTMPRGTRRELADVVAVFSKLVGQKGEAIVRVARLDKRALRWWVDSVNPETGIVELSTPDGKQGCKAHVFKLSLAPVKERGAGAYGASFETVVFDRTQPTSAEKAEKLAANEQDARDKAKAAIAARNGSK